MSATLKALGWDLDATSSDAAGPRPEWLSEESRDELADLLTKADGLIKERQNEIGHTVSTLKSLYDNSAVLKNQHLAFLARIPASPAQSPGPDSRPSSPWFADKLPRAMSDVFARGPMRHTRKISVSQSDLSFLSEQNAELLDKLSRLEAESSQADQKGRRTLQRLEDEIAQLREELDNAQARSVELEEQTRTTSPRETVEERKDRIMAARKTSSACQPADSPEDEEEVKDFAPGGALCNVTSFTTPKKPKREDTSDREELSSSTQVLISQLLAKIQELEDTNTHIVEQQHDTNFRLQSVQRETENISRLYECLNDPANVQLELVEEEGALNQPTPKKATSTSDTIRFQSFCRTLEQDVTKRLTSESSLPFHGGKPRKSVMGLFDSPATSQRGSRSQQDSSSLRLPPIPFDRRHTVSPSADSSASYSRPASPALSALSLSSHVGHGHGPQPSFSQVFGQLPTPTTENAPTLQAELGTDALDGQWGLHGESHLRRTSLYSFSSISVPPSPSPLPSSSLAFPGLTQSRSPSPSPSRGSPRTPVRPLFALEPPTPESPTTAGGEARVETPQAQRYRRMSHTVRARTNRWVDGRFRDTLLGEGPSGRRDLTAALETMADTSFAASAADVPRSPTIAGPVYEEDEEEATTTTAVQKSPSRNVVHGKQKGVVNLVVEAWLWLQFLLIILVFVWAMAKRGPKAVLREAERKRRAAA
ncbi:hypothetical protein BD626DRAFT_394773 [Schizophyllum amplum]|uniref:Uncharacterized protein n=1 Tax=Schizophyllum amplum TaxID=97359 RepID=A0A550CSX2_9AGAR|nr:hypothetical protein BD626DRAFT_394773 [Auriculariopsis ampla]